MKKKILIFGCTDDGVGTSKDLYNYRNFFTSSTGGAWLETSEINLLSDPSKADLLLILDKLQKENLDYLIMVFSGHGSYIRNDTVIEINTPGSRTCRGLPG